MSVLWSYGTTKIISSNRQDGVEGNWSYGKFVIVYDGTLADIITNGVGLDARLYKTGAPILDGTFSKATDYEFDSDIQEQMTSKGY